jgi:hypothetical protein
MALHAEAHLGAIAERWQLGVQMWWRENLNRYQKQSNQRPFGKRKGAILL